MWWGFGYVKAEADENGEFRLSGLDFQADPVVFTDDLTSMLRLRRRMQSVCLDANGVEERTYASDEVLLAPGWDESERIRMTRTPFRAQNRDDSGWFIEPLPIAPERAGDGDRAAAWPPELLCWERAGRLVAVREEAVHVMNLPAGYTVDLDAEGMVQIVADDGKVVFDRTG